MKRKIVRHGPSSLTISLPMKWIKKHNIKAGDELDIREINSFLTIGNQNQNNDKSILIDVSNIGKSINRVIGSIYRAGYDNVKIKYSNPEEFDEIQDEVEKISKGFEIFKYSSSEIQIKSIYQPNIEDFNNVLQRYFYAIKNIGVDLLDTLKKKNLDFLKTVILQDRAIDRHSNFLRRILNKGLQIEFDRPYCIYYIIEQLEIFADLYKEFAKLYYSNREKKILNDYLIIIEQINELFDIFLKAFFNFTFDKSKALFNKEKEIYSTFEKLKKNPNIDVETYSQLYLIFRCLFETKCALLTGFLK